MATISSIEWTEMTWNPVTGCSKVSPGCKNCYAERMARRLQAMGQPNYRNGFEVTLHPHLVDAPLTWKRPRKVFVNSMSDLFHERVSEEFIAAVFGVMNRAKQHQCQVLTKRSDRLLEMSGRLPWTSNIWMGVSVESEKHTDRIDHLRSIGAVVKFLSIEPLLGPIPHLSLNGIDWVIVGGESGPRARPMKSEWILEIRDQCLKQEVPFFFKQWGKLANNSDPNDPTAKRNGGKANGGRMLDGRTWDEMPACTALAKA